MDSPVVGIGLKNILMKEVFFNNQTLAQPLEEEGDVKTIVDNYAHVVKKAAVNGYKKVRYDVELDEILLSTTENLKSYCSKHARDVNCMLLLTTARHPYIEDDDEEKLEKYMLSNIRLIANGFEYDELCFEAAFLSDSFLVGFDTDEVWHQLKYIITGQVSDKDIKQSLYCVVSGEQYEDDEFAKWLDEHDVVDESSIEKCTLSPADKSISLRKDHGIDELKAHAKRLVKSPYVIKIINSTPFKSKEAKHYIDVVKDNGQIEIVLMKSDAKIGMVIQTTGRNLKETLWIARELEKRFAE